MKCWWVRSVLIFTPYSSCEHEERKVCFLQIVCHYLHKISINLFSRDTATVISILCYRLKFTGRTFLSMQQIQHA